MHKQTIHTMNNKINVTLRIRERKGGRSALILKYSPPVLDMRTMKTHCEESLHKYIYTKPRNEIEKSYNSRMLQLAEAIRCERVVRLTKAEYGFFDTGANTRSFLKYYEKWAMERGGNRVDSFNHFKRFCNGEMLFGNLTMDVCVRFKEYLLSCALRKRDDRQISNNTACDYFRAFRAVVNQAFRDKFLSENPLAVIPGIKEEPTVREYLTRDEVMKLASTPCDHDVLKRASMFSIFTGLRISDILSLRWENIVTAPDGGPCIIKTIQKVSRPEIIYVSDEALSYCGKRYAHGPVFIGLERHMTNIPLKKWVKTAGITKNISFHCFRHTFATLQIAGGTDIYTLSRQLSHRFVTTTQIYAKLVDEKRRASAGAITLK